VQTFICYSRKDSDFVEQLAADLEARGIDTWQDVDDIPRSVGAHTAGWRSAIDRALHDCTHMIVVLSPDSVASAECAAEWNYFLLHGKPVIPLLHRECEIPYRLYALQYWDLRSNYHRQLDRLAKVYPTIDQPGETGIEQLPARSTRRLPLPLIGGGLALIALIGAGALLLSNLGGDTITPTPVITSESTDDPVIIPTDTVSPGEPTPDEAATATAVMQETVAAVQQAVRDFDREMRRALETGDTTQLSSVARGTALIDRIDAVQILIDAGNCHWVYDHRSITPHEPTFSSLTDASVIATVDRDGYVLCPTGRRDQYTFFGPQDYRYTVERYEDGWVVTEFNPPTEE
jgi:hypothetical protein